MHCHEFSIPELQEIGFRLTVRLIAEAEDKEQNGFGGQGDSGSYRIGAKPRGKDG